MISNVRENLLNQNKAVDEDQSRAMEGGDGYYS